MMILMFFFYISIDKAFFDVKKKHVRKLCGTEKSFGTEKGPPFMWLDCQVLQSYKFTLLSMTDGINKKEDSVISAIHAY